MIEKPIRSNSLFLAALLNSLKRRSKALKNKNASPKIERFVDTQDGESEERIEITVVQRTRQRLTVIAWEDRAIQVQASESILQAGWKFQFVCSGRFIGAPDGREIVQALEASLSAMFEMTSENVAQLDTIWGSLLATGPRSL